MPLPRRLPWGVLLALFAGALVHEFRAGGLQPLLFMDTINDLHYARSCLGDNACPLYGVGFSVPGFTQGLSWSDLLTVARASGLGVGGIHLVLHVLAALAAVLAAIVGTRLAGPLAGVLAGALLLPALGLTEHQVTVVYNNRILLLLGVSTVALALEAAESGRFLDLALGAATAAMATETHLVGVLLFCPLAWVTLTGPRPARRTTAMAGLFAALVFVLGPASLVGNVRTLLAWTPERRPFGTPGSGLQAPDVVVLAVAAALVAAWRLAPTGSSRRAALGTLAAAVIPPVLVVEAATLAGVVDASAGRLSKYLSTWLGVLVPATVATVALGVQALVARIRPPDPSRNAARQRPAPWVAGLALSATLAAAPIPRGTDGSRLTFDEVALVGESLRAHGWTLDRALAGLRGPQAQLVLEAFARMDLWTNPPEGTPGRGGPLAVVFHAPTHRVPSPLPAGWEILGHDHRGVAGLAFVDSRLDWDHAELCVGREPGTADDDCGPLKVRAVFLPPFESAIRVDRLPAGGAPPATLSVRVPALPGTRPAGHVVWVPSSPSLCAGRVVSDPAAGPGPLVVRWQPGSPECPGYALTVFPPLVLEGDATTVDPLGALLDAEGRQ